MQFDGPQLAQLREALMTAYPSTAEFGMMLMDRLNLNIEDLAPPQNRPLVFFNVLQALNANEQIQELWQAARSHKSNNTPVKEVGEKLGLSTPTPTETLEKIVNRRLAEMLDLNAWRMRLGQIEQVVGRVVLGEGALAQPLGTGFLIGPSVVMTNHHVVAAAINGAVDPRTIRVQFDYYVSPTGSVAAGMFVPLHQDWLIKAVPHSSVDVTTHDITVDAKEGELDFALLRLAKAVGAEPFGPPSGSGTAPPRGWIDLREHAAQASQDDPIIIAQHPDGKPLKLAIDTESVIGYSPSRRRLRYRTNTEPGSSGSPAFNYKLQILALHHSGDPNWFNPPEYNEGVPIKAITNFLGDELLKKISE